MMRGEQDRRGFTYVDADALAAAIKASPPPRPLPPPAAPLEEPGDPRAPGVTRGGVLVVDVRTSDFAGGAPLLYIARSLSCFRARKLN